MTSPMYSHVENAKDIGKINREIRSQIRSAKTRKFIIELKRRSGYLITLTHSKSWKKRHNVAALRKRAKTEYITTSKVAEARLKAIGRKR